MKKTESKARLIIPFILLTLLVYTTPFIAVNIAKGYSALIPSRFSTENKEAVALLENMYRTYRVADNLGIVTGQVAALSIIYWMCKVLQGRLTTGDMLKSVFLLGALLLAMDLFSLYVLNLGWHSVMLSKMIFIPKLILTSLIAGLLFIAGSRRQGGNRFYKKPVFWICAVVVIALPIVAGTIYNFAALFPDINPERFDSFIYIYKDLFWRFFDEILYAALMGFAFMLGKKNIRFYEILLVSIIGFTIVVCFDRSYFNILRAPVLITDKTAVLQIYLMMFFAWITRRKAEALSLSDVPPSE